MLALVFEYELEHVAVALEGVTRVEVEAFEIFEHGSANATEVRLHLRALGEILRILARRRDGVEYSLVARVGRGQALGLLQQPVSLEDSYVREVPDDGAVAEAGALVQVALVADTEE